MVDNTSVGNANPLDTGANPNSVETAATEFSALLRDEKSVSDGPRTNRPRRSEPKGEPERMFADVTPQTVPDAAPSDEDGQTPDDDVDPILTDGALPDDGDDPDQPDEADADEEPDEGSDTDELDLDREVEVTVAGEVQKVPLKEALAGYSREADYRQKTARLADERREVAEYAQNVVQERQVYAQNLNRYLDTIKALQPDPNSPDWAALKAQDPQKYIVATEQWAAVQQSVQQAELERQQIEERYRQDHDRTRGEWIKSENERLLQAVPALANQKKLQEFRNTIFSYGKRAGYSQEELASGAVDHRDVMTLYKAARYDQLMQARKTGNRGQQRSNKPQPKPSVDSQPRAISRPGRTGKNGSSALREADRALERSGSLNSAAKAFTELVKAGG